MGAAVTCVAVVVARRYARRSRSEPVLTLCGEEGPSSWIIGLSSSDS